MSEQTATTGRFGEPGQPVTSLQRLITLDFVRGVAVLGILFANITAYSHPLITYSWPGALPSGGTVADGWIWLFQFVFVDGKFRGLFTILFGAGLVLFVDRARMRGSSAWLQVRRLALLLVFGLAHFALLFVGDILFAYALAGFVGLAFIDSTGREQIRIAVLWYFLAALAFMLLAVAPVLTEQLPAADADGAQMAQALADSWETQIARAAEESAVLSGPSYRAIVQFRLDQQGFRLWQAPYLVLSETVPLMLLGMGLYRTGLFSGALGRHALLCWGWSGFGAGAFVSLALGCWAFALGFPPQLTTYLFTTGSALVRLPMIVGLMALLVVWAPAAAVSRIGVATIAAGRMAFSNYIGCSVMMMLVFQGWAGGLFGQLHRASLLIFVVLGWALMLSWSAPWLARYRYGPLEWLWRCATYGRLFAFRHEKLLDIATKSH